MFLITLDVDWAPDFVLDLVFAEIAARSIRATVFATHSSPAIQNVHSCFDVGIHPNITNLCEAEQRILKLKETFPTACCLRNHSLTTSSRLLSVYSRCGISVTSNYAMYGMSGLSPVALPHGITEYPIWYMDDLHAMRWAQTDAQQLLDDLIGTDGLKVLAFHPIHIYINSCGSAAYESAKHGLDDREKLASLVNDGPGIRTFFEDVLALAEVKKRAQTFPA